MSRFLMSSLLAIFHFLNANLKAVFAIIYVYFIGLYYVVYEFSKDNEFGLKFLGDDELQQRKLKQWRKYLSSIVVQRNKSLEQNTEQSKTPQLVAVITGADGTIGSEILNYLIRLEFFVFVVGSSPPKDLFNNNGFLTFIKCDLSARNEVFDAIERVQLECDQIDLLIFNAAMMLYPEFEWLPYRRDLLGEKIVEKHLSVNVLASAQIFASLSSRLENSSLQNPRAIFISSCTAHAGNISLLLVDPESFWCLHLNGYKAYADSKLLLSIYVKYISGVLNSVGSKISVCSVHPGVVPGKLYRHVFLPIRCFINFIFAPFMRSPRLAASYVLDLAFAENIQNGIYYENGIPATLKGIEDPDNVLMIGKSVREMIVDNDGDIRSLLNALL